MKCPKCKLPEDSPVDFKAFSEHIRYDWECIKCGHTWSTRKPFAFRTLDPDWSELWFGLIMLGLLSLLLFPLYLTV